MTATPIHATEQLWRAEPEKAQGKPTVTARSDGSQAVLEFGSFSWRADLPAPLGGSNTAPSPTALLLSALAGCAVVFIRDTLAPQLGVQIGEVQAIAQCQADSRGLLGIDDVAADLQNLHLTIRIQSSDNEEKVQQLYQVWLERCPIYLALVKPMQVQTTLDIQAEA